MLTPDTHTIDAEGGHQGTRLRGDHMESFIDISDPSDNNLGVHLEEQQPPWTTVDNLGTTYVAFYDEDGQLRWISESSSDRVCTKCPLMHV